MSDLLIKTEVWLVNGPILAKLAESSNVLHEGHSAQVGNNLVYKSDDDEFLYGDYVTHLRIHKSPKLADVKLGEKPSAEEPQ